MKNILIDEFTVEESVAHYWQNTSYSECVRREIAKKYSFDQEIAIMRQKDDKPDEHQAWYDYCESCKAFVKEMKAKYSENTGAESDN